MYWPDLSWKKKKHPHLWLIIPMGIALGVFLSGNLNGWWSVPSLPGREADNVVPVEQQPFSVISATGPANSPSPELADSADLTFPLIRDDNGSVSLEVFDVLGLPTTIIIRPDGTIATVQVGQMSDEQIEEISGKLVAGKPFN